MTTLRATASNTSTTGTLSLTVPAGTQTGDAIYVVAAGAWFPQAPSGYTLQATEVQSSKYANWMIAKKVAPGTPGNTSTDAGTTVSVTLSGGSADSFGVLIVIQGDAVIRGVALTGQLSATQASQLVQVDGTDLVAWFGWARTNVASTTAAVDRGVSAQTGTTTNAGGVLTTETPAAGTLVGTVSSNKTPTSTYATVGIGLAFHNGTLHSGSAYAQAVLADSPLGFWELGLDPTDASGNGHILIPEGGTTIAAATSISQGAPASPGCRLQQVQGSTARADLGGFTPASTSTWSIETWIRVTDLTAGPIFSCRNVSADVSMTLYWGNFAGVIGVAGQLVFGYDAPSIAFMAGHDFQAYPVADGQWHHVVVTWSGTAASAITAAQMKLYVDGVDATRNTGTAGTAPNAPISMNASGGGYRLHSSGGTNSGPQIELDSFAIYSTALSAARVLAHYQAALLSNGFADLANLDATRTMQLPDYDTTGWTTEAGEGLSHTGWTTIKPMTAMSLTIANAGSTFTPQIYIYTGTSIAGLTTIASGSGSVTAQLTAGTTYRVQVGDIVGGSGGTLRLKVTPGQPGRVFKGHGTAGLDTSTAA